MVDNQISWQGHWRQICSQITQSPSFISFIIPTLLMLLAVAVYANSFPGSFILDDQIIVVQNSLVQHLDFITIFRSDYWHNINSSGLYRPLTIISLALNRYVFGPEPLSFHFVNILLHGAVTVLLWRALRVWGLPTLAALIAATLFAVHPIHTEVINEVVGRSELLAAFFILLGFNFARSRRTYYPLLVSLCFLLALFAKEHSIMFLVLLPVWEFFLSENRVDWQRRWPLYISLITIAVGWLLWRQYGVISPIPQLRLSEAAAPLAYVDGMTRVLTALNLQWLYVAKLFFPHGLQGVYSAPDLPVFIGSFLSAKTFLLLGGTAGVILLIIYGWRQRNPLALFSLLYLLAFLPTSNLLFPIGVSFAERLVYFPSVWFCAGLGVFCAALIKRQSLRKIFSLILIVYFLFLAVTTLVRNPDFASEQKLWRAEVTNNPADFVGWLNLAESLIASREFSAADQAYQSMLTAAPDDPSGLRSRLAFLLIQGDYLQALPLASRLFTVSEKQGDIVAMAFDGRSMAEVYLGLGECAKALVYLEGPALPLRQQPQTIEARLATLSCLGRDADVISDLKELDKDVLTRRMHYQHTVSLMRLGRLADARALLQQGVDTKSLNGEEWNLLGVICVQMNDWPGAIKAFASAVISAPANAEYKDNLLRAQQEEGR